MTDLAQRAERILELRGSKRAYWIADPHQVTSDMAEIIRELLAENERLRALVLAKDLNRNRVGSPFPMIDATGCCFVCGKHHGNLPCQFTQPGAVDAGPTPLRGRVTRRDE